MLSESFEETGFPERIPLPEAALVNKGWIQGAGESLVLFVVESRGRSSGYLTVSPLRDVLWLREFYLDGRTWRGAPARDAQPVMHRGLGKLILATFDEWALQRGRPLGVFTTRSLGLLTACDHLFGDRCQYHVTDGDPPVTLFRQRGLRWLPQVDTYSAVCPPYGVLLFHRTDDGFVDDRVQGQTFRLEPSGGRLCVREPEGRLRGPQDGVLVSIGPSVDILVFPPQR